MKQATTLKGIALRCTHSVMHCTGLGLAYRTLLRVRGATILMYHSVPGKAAARFIDPANAISPDDFALHVAFLARRRRVVPMAELVRSIQRGETQPPGTVVLTFDDGYLDSLEVAAPILAEHRLPALLYLATGYVSRAEPQWIDEVYTAFRYRTRARLSLANVPSGSLDDASELGATYRAVCRQLISLGPEARREALHQITEQLAPSLAPPKLTLDWSDVRRMRQLHPTFSLGVHTDGHVDLTGVRPPEAEREVRASIQVFERELGYSPEHFSFPYGRHEEGLRQLVRSVGLQSAVGAGDDLLITAHADPFGLARIESPRSLQLLSFYTSGAYPGLPRMLLGRA